MTASVERFSLPLERPLDTATGRITSREGFLVSLDGGIGEATPLPGWTESIDACKRALVAATDKFENGEDVLAGLEECPAARHGLELALADRAARAAGVSLATHLGGGEPLASVPVNATVGDGSVEATAAAVVEARDAGLECCKLKVGRRSLSSDLERIDAARRAAPDVDIRVDANGSWSHATAESALPSLAANGVSLLEQPLPADQLEASAMLRGRGVPIGLDESLNTLGLEAILEHDAADAVVVKPMAVGGVCRALDKLEAAAAAGVAGIVSTTIDGLVARLGALHVAATRPDPLPAGIATGDRLASDLGDSPIELTDGRLPLPVGSGLGLEPGWRHSC